MIIAVVGFFFIATGIIGLYTIAWYTSRIRAIEKGKRYTGFLIEVLLKSGLNNDFWPILMTPPANADKSNYPVYQQRNLVVRLYWAYLFLFILIIAVLKLKHFT